MREFDLNSESFAVANYPQIVCIPQNTGNFWVNVFLPGNRIFIKMFINIHDI